MQTTSRRAVQNWRPMVVWRPFVDGSSVGRGVRCGSVTCWPHRTC